MLTYFIYAILSLIGAISLEQAYLSFKDGARELDQRKASYEATHSMREGELLHGPLIQKPMTQYLGHPLIYSEVTYEPHITTWLKTQSSKVDANGEEFTLTRSSPVYGKSVRHTTKTKIEPNLYMTSKGRDFSLDLSSARIFPKTVMTKLLPDHSEVVDSRLHLGDDVCIFGKRQDDVVQVEILGDVETVTLYVEETYLKNRRYSKHIFINLINALVAFSIVAASCFFSS